MLSPSQQAVAVRAYAAERIRGAGVETDDGFAHRLDEHLPRLLTCFTELYGDREDCLERLGDLLVVAARASAERPDDLRALDEKRLERPGWFLDNRMLGGVCYADRWAGGLAGVRARIPYFRELGLTYLHLMPLFAAPEGDSDGGYAVSDYRRVDPAIGSIEELRALAAELRASGIALVLDFVFNHTSDEHAWAVGAVAGEERSEGFYRIYPDRTLPDAFERTTREIFPDDHPGSFVQLPDGRWIWSTFHRFQWDLDYANPAVLSAMAGEMLFLANLGVEVLRMDAVAFIWKQLGTSCENLPQAHTLIRAFNAVCRIAAPALLFKSEAIVHPDRVIEYVDPHEAQLSYDPLQMALTWEALATRDVSLLSQALERRHAVPAGCAWVEYVRGHDDIGWTFADEDAAELGIDPAGHRRFLNDFYTDRFPGGFARGVPFQQDPVTGDARVSGTTASLAGVEAGDPHGVRRVLLAHAIAFSTGGVPLIYLGDEVAQLNDPTALTEPGHEEDSRWVHRPRYPAERYAQRNDPVTDAGAVFRGLKRLIAVRRSTPELAGGDLVPFHTHDRAVLGYQRPGRDGTVLVLANVSEEPVHVPREVLAGLPAAAVDLVTDIEQPLWAGLDLDPLQFVWLQV